LIGVVDVVALWSFGSWRKPGPEIHSGSGNSGPFCARRNASGGPLSSLVREPSASPVAARVSRVDPNS
jgi:hypothetical protein